MITGNTSPPMPDETWMRRARYVSNYDGDTITVDLSVGFGWTMGAPNSMRLLGIDAPERYKLGGAEAREFTHAFCAPHPDDPSWPLRIRTEKDGADKYGARWGAFVWRVRDGACLNTALLAAGHAKAYDGGKR